MAKKPSNPRKPTEVETLRHMLNMTQGDLVTACSRLEDLETAFQILCYGIIAGAVLEFIIRRYR